MQRSERYAAQAGLMAKFRLRLRVRIHSQNRIEHFVFFNDPQPKGNFFTAISSRFEAHSFHFLPHVIAIHPAHALSGAIASAMNTYARR